jgi:hypothetical protein
MKEGAYAGQRVYDHNSTSAKSVDASNINSQRRITSQKISMEEKSHDREINANRNSSLASLRNRNEPERATESFQTHQSNVTRKLPGDFSLKSLVERNQSDSTYNERVSSNYDMNTHSRKQAALDNESTYQNRFSIIYDEYGNEARRIISENVTESRRLPRNSPSSRDTVYIIINVQICHYRLLIIALY